jgi:hypothetical protein
MIGEFDYDSLFFGDNLLVCGSTAAISNCHPRLLPRIPHDYANCHHELAGGLKPGLPDGIFLYTNPNLGIFFRA